MIKKKSKGNDVPEVNASSMADIAFLLLVFFLVTTTIATDKGVRLTLPPFDENTEVKIHDRDVLKVLINYKNELLVEDEPLEIEKLEQKVIDHLTNVGQPDFPVSLDKAIVSVKADRGTDYTVYLTVLDQIKAGYHKMRAKAVGLTVGEYLTLNHEQDPKEREIYERAKEAYPMNISEAQPSEIGE